MRNKIIESIVSWLQEVKRKPIKFPEVFITPKGLGINPRGKQFNCKLGGEPNWIQSPEVPKCRKCRIPMSFVGQLASIGCNPKGMYEEFTYADCGAYFVFSCLECEDNHRVIFQSF